MWKIRVLSNSVKKQWKVVTIFIVGLKWVIRSKKEEMCAFGATLSEVCWFCISLSSSLSQDQWVNWHTGWGKSRFLWNPQTRVSFSHPCQVRGNHLWEALPSSEPFLDLWDESPVESPSPTLRHFHFHSSPGSAPTRFRGNWKHRSPKKEKAGAPFWATLWVHFLLFS